MEKAYHLLIGIAILTLILLSIHLNLPILTESLKEKSGENTAFQLEDYRRKAWIKAPDRLMSMDQKLQGFDWIYQGYIDAIQNQLSAGNPKNLSELSLPFEQVCAVYVARKSKLIYSRGPSFPSHFNNGWERHFFLGLYHGEKLFASKIKFFYPRSISYRDFLSYSGAFQAFRRKGQYLAWYLGFYEDYSILILLDF